MGAVCFGNARGFTQKALAIMLPHAAGHYTRVAENFTHRSLDPGFDHLQVFMLVTSWCNSCHAVYEKGRSRERPKIVRKRRIASMLVLDVYGLEKRESIVLAMRSEKPNLRFAREYRLTAQLSNLIIRDLKNPSSGRAR